jgi:hypothetical protein
VTGRDDPKNEMTNLPSQTRIDFRAAELLLSGNFQPEQLPGELRPVAELLAALQPPPGRREMSGWGGALASYRETVGPFASPARGHASRRRSFVPSLLSARLAAAVIVVLAALVGGGMTAAYTGSLPAPLQKLAHQMIAAPAARGSRGSTGSPAVKHLGRKVGPSATGPAAFGLCNAYQHAVQHGDAAEQAVAFRNLADAAGGASKVAAFCAGVSHPGASGSHGRGPGQAGPPGQSGGHGKQSGGSGNGNGPGNGNGNGPGSGNGNGPGSGNGKGEPPRHVKA